MVTVVDWRLNHVAEESVTRSAYSAIGSYETRACQDYALRHRVVICDLVLLLKIAPKLT